MKKLLVAFCIFSLISCNNNQKQNESTITDFVEEKKTKIIPEDSTNKLESKLEWIAYKFEDKTPVKGQLTEMQIDYNKKGNTIEEKLSKATFKVNKESVFTDDEARDYTLKEYFFKKLIGDIHGEVGEMKEGNVEIILNMNDKSTSKLFTYTLEGNQVNFKGEIDIIKDFVAQTAFDSLHEACSVHHEGKTWTDVAIEVSITL